MIRCTFSEPDGWGEELGRDPGFRKAFDLQSNSVPAQSSSTARG
jgi:hypothetical protein